MVKVKVNKYFFNLNEDYKAYEDMCSLLKEKYKYKKFCVISEAVNLPDQGIIDTKYLFSNQYNLTTGERVHDWFERYNRNENIKSGYYLTGDIEELNNLKDKQYRCGFCGYTINEQQNFCSKCLGSAYLKDSELHLLRMKPVSWTGTREQLSKEENDTMMPLYIEAQTVLKENVKAKKYKEFEEEYQSETSKASVKRNGFIWLLDHDINIDNCIYYSHKNEFSFGWRNKLSEKTVSELKIKLKHFPYKVSFK